MPNEILAIVIRIVFNALFWAIFIRIIISWLPMLNIQVDPYNPLVQFLFNITDPILEPLRPYSTVGMIDLSPMVAMVALWIIEAALLSLLL